MEFVQHTHWRLTRQSGPFPAGHVCTAEEAEADFWLRQAERQPITAEDALRATTAKAEPKPAKPKR